METKTLVALIIVAVLLIAAGWAGWAIRDSSIEPPPAPIEHTVQLPGRIIEGPARVVVERVPIVDSSTILAQDAEIKQLRAEKRVVEEKLARLETVYVEIDTSIVTEVVILRGDSTVSTHILEEKMRIRYQDYPYYKFHIERPNESFKVPLPITVNQLVADAPGFFSDMWEHIKTTAAVIVAIEIIAGVMYVLLA